MIGQDVEKKPQQQQTTKLFLLHSISLILCVYSNVFGWRTCLLLYLPTSKKILFSHEIKYCSKANKMGEIPIILPLLSTLIPPLGPFLFLPLFPSFQSFIPSISLVLSHSFWFTLSWLLDVWEELINYYRISNGNNNCCAIHLHQCHEDAIIKKFEEVVVMVVTMLHRASSEVIFLPKKFHRKQNWSNTTEDK